MALALPLLMAGMAAVALLGPVLVAAAAARLWPLAATGPAARLALASITAACRAAPPPPSSRSRWRSA